MRAILFAVLLSVLMPANSVESQAFDGCRLRARDTSRVRLPNGQTFTVNVQALARRDSSLLILGSPSMAWTTTGDPALPLKDNGVLGVLLSRGASPRPIVAPPGHRRAVHPRAVPRRRGWDILWFLPDLVDPGTDDQENGTLWIAHFDARGWSGVQRVADLRRAAVGPEMASALVAHRDTLRFAVGVRTSGPGGAILFASGLPGRPWIVDTLRTITAPLYTALPLDPPTDQPLTAYFVAPTLTRDTIDGGTLYSIRFGDSEGRPHALVSSGIMSIGGPLVVELDDERLLVTWWQLPATPGDTPRIWAATLDGEHQRVTSRHEIARGTVEYSFALLRTPQGDRPLWLYRVGAEAGQLHGALMIDGAVRPLGTVSAVVHAYFRIAASGVASADLVSAEFPFWDPAVRPAATVTRLVLECAERGG